MTITAPYVQDLMLIAAAGAINGGTIGQNAILSIYTAPRPASPINGATGVLLASVLLPNPAAVGPNNQELTLQTAGLTTSVLADGKASWVRLKNRDNTTILDGSVGLIGSDSDVELEIVDLISTDILNLGNIPLRFRCP